MLGSQIAQQRQFHRRLNNANIKSDKGDSNGDIQFITEDPDSVSTAISISTLLNGNLPPEEDASVRLRVRKRGFGVQTDFKPTQGRPYVRATKVDARLTDRSTTTVS